MGLGFPLPILLVCPLAGALFSNQHSDAEGSSAQTLVTQQWLDCCSARCCEWGYWLCSKPSKYSAASAFLGAFRLGKSGTYFTHQVLHEGSWKQIWLGDLPLGGQEKRRIIFAWGVLLLMDFIYLFFYFYFFTALKLCLSQLLKHLDLSAYWLVCFHFNPGLYNWRNFINTVKKKNNTLKKCNTTWGTLFFRALYISLSLAVPFAEQFICGFKVFILLKNSVKYLN